MKGRIGVLGGCQIGVGRHMKVSRNFTSSCVVHNFDFR